MCLTPLPHFFQIRQTSLCLPLLHLADATIVLAFVFYSPSLHKAHSSAASQEQESPPIGSLTQKRVRSPNRIASSLPFPLPHRRADRTFLYQFCTLSNFSLRCTLVSGLCREGERARAPSFRFFSRFFVLGGSFFLTRNASGFSASGFSVLLRPVLYRNRISKIQLPIFGG